MTSSEFLPPLLPGETLAGKYRIERVLGRGGMGMVLAARNVDLGERVAIKILNRELTPDVAKRFLAEGRAAASLRSDHVVRVFDYGLTEAGQPYLVMEYLEGRDLAQLLEQAGRVTPELAVQWTLEACEALAHAHRQGIVHRDLKPANLFLEQRATGSPRIKLLDFGVAKLPAEFDLTSTHQTLGSPGYMAPEQFSSSRDVDGRADIWALGGVLYELLTGQRPFSGETLFELASHVRDQAHLPALALRSDLPPGLSAIVDRCLVKERALRWADTAALARALSEFASADGQRLVRDIQSLGAAPEDPGATLEGPARNRDWACTELAGGEPASTAGAERAGSGPSTSIAAHSDVLLGRFRSSLRPVLALGLVLALALGVLLWRSRSLLPAGTDAAGAAGAGVPLAPTAPAPAASTLGSAVAKPDAPATHLPASAARSPSSTPAITTSALQPRVGGKRARLEKKRSAQPHDAPAAEARPAQSAPVAPPPTAPEDARPAPTPLGEGPGF